MRLLRHLLAIAALPFMVTVVIPRWIVRGAGVVPAVHGGALLFVQLLGVVLLAIGLLLFASSLRRFATEGHGTLAPWDPPRRLVVRGPYRHVRNPMISGVVFVLFGEAATLLSRGLLQWALLFLAINAVYIPLIEEPMLRDRFGAEYDEYRRRVPRLLPRVTPWRS
ncbi:MAG TPA: methyltransferase [Gemmatimonadaceae bacterium]|nr:methyltransferase [Gemmatimonadaceae bacterium]HEX2779662.1 methyltransferase [Gemmatimonadaceae bacterium]